MPDEITPTNAPFNPGPPQTFELNRETESIASNPVPVYPAAPLNPAPTQQFAVNPTTGQFEPLAPVAAPQSSDAKQSFFQDDVGELLFSGPVMLDGAKVMVRELTAAEMTIYQRNERAVGELMRELRGCDDDSVAIISAKIEREQMANFDFVIKHAVASWEMVRPDKTPVPCTPETKLLLWPSNKAELTDKIVQRSQVGRDLSGFLAES